MPDLSFAELVKRHDCIAVFGMVPLDAAAPFLRSLPKDWFCDSSIGSRIGATLVAGPGEGLDALRTALGIGGTV